MTPLRVLITNNALVNYAGSECYVRDLALALQKRGHRPVVYSSVLGRMARDLVRATVPVIDDLRRMGEPPDLIHGQHHLDAMTAILRFPGTPAVYVCHGWTPWEEMAPVFPRILKYVAVDDVCRDRLVSLLGIPADRVEVVLNFVDLERFSPRGPLPAKPARALVFSNSAADDGHAEAVRRACGSLGIAVDMVGAESGRATPHPEQVLGDYDLVFAKARCALEAMAVGCAVVLCDKSGSGEMVTTGNLEPLRRLNFGLRSLHRPATPKALAEQIRRYDPADAGRVSAWVRENAGIDTAIDRICGIYGEVVKGHAEDGPRGGGLEAEMVAASDYWRQVVSDFKRNAHSAREAKEDAALAQRKVDRMRRTMERISDSRTWRWSRRVKDLLKI